MKSTAHGRAHLYVKQIPFVLVAIAGTAVILYTTSWGAGLSDDSYHYIHAARDLLAGSGLTIDPHFPPLLSFLLAMTGFTGVDPLSSIRWLNAILFGANIYLFGHIALHFTKSVPFSFLSAFLFLVSSSLIEAHSWAMSEPLFFTLALLGIGCYLIPPKESTMPRAIISGLCFGLAMLTRYIGVSLILAGGISWLFIGGKIWKDRLRRMLAFALASLIPNLFWFTHNKILYEYTTGRIWDIHPPTSGWWWQIVNTILIWFVPGRFVHGKEQIWLILLGLGLTGLAIWFYWNKRTALIQSLKSMINLPFVVFLLLAIFSYLSVLVLSRTFLDPIIPSDNRLFSMVWILVLLLLFYSLARIWENKKWLPRTIVVVFTIGLVFVNVFRSVETVKSYHQNGRGYASSMHHRSETYTYIRERPEIPIYSNSYAAIYFWTGLESEPIPPSSGVSAMHQEMKRTGANLIIFNFISLELYHVTFEELTKGLEVVITLSDATIYRHP